MKKSLLLLAAGAITLTAGAQNSRLAPPASYAVPAVQTAHADKKVPQTQISTHKSTERASHSAARTTSTCTYTENFSTGTYTTMPTGWTAVATSGPGTWHWANVASTTSFSLGAIASPTASNGWMIFDSDSLGGGTGTGTVMPAGYLQSPSYNCSSLSTVRLSFYEFYAAFQDSTEVWVGHSTSGPWTVYKIPVNDALGNNDGTVNPTLVHLDISATAALQPAVYIRFVTATSHGGGAYSWMIDDICVGPKDPHDVGLEKSFVYLPTCTPTTGSEESSLFATPLQVVDSIYPVTFLSNFGSSSETAVALSASLYHAPLLPTGSPYTSLYTFPAITYPTLVPNSADSLVQFDGFKPTVTGNYFVALGTTVTGDGDATNDADTVGFTVTDTLWQNNSGSYSRANGFIVHSPASGSSAERSFMWGTRFDVPCTYTANDTISGFQVAFSSGSHATNTGGSVIVQLYSGDKTVASSGTGWTYVGSSVARAVGTSNISTSMSTVWCDFRIDQQTINAPVISPFILQSGLSYVAVVQTIGVTTELDIIASKAPNASPYSGYFGQLQTGGNDGAQSFGTSTTTNLGDIVPFVRMSLGTVKLWLSGVTNINNAGSIGDAYPNPSNTTVTVPFTMTQNAKVTVTLTDIIGQTVSTQTVNAVGGQDEKVVFNTADLAAGVYMYTVLVDGQHTTGRVVVSH